MNTQLVPCLTEFPDGVRPYGFVPADIPGIDAEEVVTAEQDAPRQSRLARVRCRLGFDPRLQSNFDLLVLPGRRHGEVI